MTQTESLARFRMLQSNQMIAPGKCAGCGKYSNDDFLDLGLEVDFYGVVYLCRECLTEAAMVFGFRPDAHYKKMEKALALMQANLNASRDREEALRGALASIDTHIDRSDVADFSFPAVEADEQSGHPNDQINAREQRSNEQVDERGHSDVRHDDSIELLLGNAGLDI